MVRADLEAVPLDGHRYELIDGPLVVTPAPQERRQTAAVDQDSTGVIDPATSSLTA